MINCKGRNRNGEDVVISDRGYHGVRSTPLHLTVWRSPRSIYHVNPVDLTFNPGGTPQHGYDIVFLDEDCILLRMSNGFNLRP